MGYFIIEYKTRNKCSFYKRDLRLETRENSASVEGAARPAGLAWLLDELDLAMRLSFQSTWVPLLHKYCTTREKAAVCSPASPALQTDSNAA